MPAIKRRCLLTIKVLDPAMFRDIFGALSDYSDIAAYSLKKDKMTVGIFIESEEDEEYLAELEANVLDLLKHFSKETKKIKNKAEKEYSKKQEWCSYCEPCGW